MKQLAFAVKIRATNPGPVRRNNSNTELTCRGIGQFSHAARAWPTVAEYDGLTCRVAIFLKGNRARGKLNKLFPVHARAGRKRPP